MIKFLIIFFLSFVIDYSESEVKHMNEIKTYIEEQYDINFKFPKIIKITQKELQKRWLNNNSTFREVNIIYDPETQIIYTTELDLDNIIHRGWLIHELVHHIQYKIRKNETKECINELEEEAYEIQIQYLIDHGFENIIYLNNLKIKKIFLSKCYYPH